MERTQARRLASGAPDWWIERWLALLCALASAVVVAAVAAGARTLPTFGLYLFATGVALWLLARGDARRPALPRWPDLAVAGGLAAGYLAAAALVARNPYHFHYDEFITAYASLTLPRLDEVDWFAGYPEAGQWVAQFPIPFFILQKPVLALLGPSVEAVRLSAWPYHVGVALYLYALAGLYVRGRVERALTVVAFVLLAPNLFLAAMGVHFPSSTFCLVAAVYHFARMVRDGSRLHATLCGLFAALCYLTYSSSYLIAPLLVAYAALHLALGHPPRLELVGRAVVAFELVLAPFVAYAVTAHNYFSQRTGQVGGVWVDALTGDAPLGQRAARLWELLSEALATNARAVYQPGIGGVTHYDFGHQALLDPITLAVLGAGAAVALWRGLRWGGAVQLYPVIAIVGGFLVGMALTFPAGAFHRLSVVFPFAGLLVGMAAQALGRVAGRPGAVVLVTGIVAVNLARLPAMMPDGSETPSVHIARYVERHVPPGREIVVAGDPAYHLARELFFRLEGEYRFRTGWWEDSHGWIDAQTVVVLPPDPGQVAWLVERFGPGRVVETVDGAPLKGHVLWVPESAAREARQDGQLVAGLEGAR